jgi:hypothetical protein
MAEAAYIGPRWDLIFQLETFEPAASRGCRSVPRDATLTNAPQDPRQHNQRAGWMSRESSAPDA